MKPYRFLITSGPTRANLDEVRYLGNRSSGRLGVEIARSFLAQGVRVDFLYGLDSLTPEPPESTSEWLELFPVETISDLLAALSGPLSVRPYDAIIHLMAVLDYQPELTQSGKVKTRDGEWNVRLVPTPKIIDQLRQQWPSTYLVGFKLEVGVPPEQLIASARELMDRCRADLVVANDLTSIKAGSHLAYFVPPSPDDPIHEATNKPAIAQKLSEIVLANLT